MLRYNEGSNIVPDEHQMKNLNKLQVELIDHLNEQYEFLITSGESFDNGRLNEGKRIATHLRTLVHQTEKSHSLLNQLKKQLDIEIKILSKSVNLPKNPIFYCGLTIQMNNKDANYVPMMDLTHPLLREVAPDAWWNNVLLIINSKSYTRKDILLGLANKDGGAHIDLNPEDAYYKLTREVKVFESSGKFDMGKFELSFARESGFFMTLALKKYFGEFIKNS